MCHSRNAIHEHLKGIDPKLLKFSAAKKESLAPLLRASKRLLQRKGRCVCVCVCERERERESVCVCVCARARVCVRVRVRVPGPQVPFLGIWVAGFF